MKTTPSNRRSRQVSGAPFKVSFEVFPARTKELSENLQTTVNRLAAFEPEFVSVTYGAGGSTRQRTRIALETILNNTKVSTAAHLTCVGASKSETNAILKDYLDLGVHKIVALRGDPLEGIGAPYIPHPDGYAYASDLVAGIKRLADFDVTVSGYPERHPESSGWQMEIDNLKRKVDAGADRIVTQYFFDNDIFESYHDRVLSAGINIPVVPGILPIHNFEQTVKFSAKCGASIPLWLSRRFAGLQDDPETRRLVGVGVACEQVMDLVDRGVDSFHFYTMNRHDLTSAICHMLGMGTAFEEKTAA